MHGNDNQEYLPEDAEDCKGFSGNGHIREGTADVERQQRDDDIVKDFINNRRKILDCIVKGISDLLAAHGRQAES